MEARDAAAISEQALALGSINASSVSGMCTISSPMITSAFPGSIDDAMMAKAYIARRPLVQEPISKLLVG